ncbi:MAG TPA: peptidoglycan DD-metalloendopeptidase family protein [Flavobacteriales bacterium]|nr:peptidoglycan DD-metalloendopeptidase family protein [Flavobacteriales bacterium]HRO39024.1 peptidoglycan DD-metalloendopeptidase family protein [Flavobacteriales bacterium]HRP81023.1 peptidoglycan DD-metalloendopeptidase family protein [Flavobacteriales bacterium]HRQ85316.1 peptidoglycan DD-metalloendopeptidase family protein [Flavobacteriales bacterium]
MHCLSAYRRSSAAWIRRCATAVLLAACLVPAQAQSRKELQKKQDALDAQIKQTSALLDKARNAQRNTQQQVQLLDAQIGQRQELIQAMNGELVRMDRSIQDGRDSIHHLEGELEHLKQEYARMVQFAYMNRSAYDRLSYIFAAESFAQAFRRSRYLDQLARHRSQQAELIGDTRRQLEEKVGALEDTRRDKSTLLNRQQGEARQLAQDKKEQQGALEGLRKQEGQLKQTLAKQERQRQELAAAIRKAIEAEIARSRAAANKTSSPAAKAATGFSLTPEAKELNADFEKNRGKLPWPVEKGTITSSFGKQPHPVLKGIQIENNGLDIGCNPGVPVRAIFRGEVSSVIVIPGAGKAVMLSHGAYRTVYSNLRDVAVNKGDKVDTKQVVGTVMTEDGASTAHLEIWKIGSDGQLQKVNPAAWIMQ